MTSLRVSLVCLLLLLMSGVSIVFSCSFFGDTFMTLSHGQLIYKKLKKEGLNTFKDNILLFKGLFLGFLSCRGHLFLSSDIIK